MVRWVSIHHSNSTHKRDPHACIRLWPKRGIGGILHASIDWRIEFTEQFKCLLLNLQTPWLITACSPVTSGRTAWPFSSSSLLDETECLPVATLALFSLSSLWMNLLMIFLALVKELPTTLAVFDTAFVMSWWVGVTKEKYLLLGGGNDVFEASLSCFLETWKNI